MLRLRPTGISPSVATLRPTICSAASASPRIGPRARPTPNCAIISSQPCSFIAESAIESIDYPNRAASETDFYFGVRPTFDKLALDFGGWYYWYPGGRTFNGLGGTAADGSNANCTNGFIASNASCNVYEGDASFWEVYGKATYTFTDTFTLGGNVFYDPILAEFGR